MTPTLPIGYCFESTLRDREVAGLRLLESRYRPGFRSAPHVHAAASFCLVLQGRFTHTYRDETLRCEPRSLLFYPADEPHSEAFQADGARCFIIELSASWRARMSLDSGRSRAGSRMRGPASNLAWRLYQESRESDPYSPLILEGITLELLAEVLRHGASEPTARRSTAMDRARELIESAAPGATSLSVIAAALGMHPVHVAHAFRRTHGCSVGQYTRRLRLERACHALAASRAPLAEIAVEAGYCDQSHMTREFRRALRTTPARYRAAFRSR